MHHPLRRAAIALSAVALATGAISLVARDDDDHDAAAAPGSVDRSLDRTIPDVPVIEPPVGGVPDIDARAYAVYDVAADLWLTEQRADAPVAVGSVMKLLTAHVVLQAGDLDRVVTVPELEAGDDESLIGLYEGERLRRDVLLRAMLIVSANDAARALAVDVGGSIDGFVERMNAAARELGLDDTVAANPVGLDAPGAHSSARDMVALAATLMRDETFRQAVVRSSANLHGETFPATNDLLTAYDGATGVKTGSTSQAGYCLIGAASRDGRELIVAVLGAPSEDARVRGAAALLDWRFSQP